MQTTANLDQTARTLQPRSLGNPSLDDVLRHIEMLLRDGDISIEKTGRPFSHDPFSGESFERVLEKLRGRFRKICCNLSVKEFDLLMDKMARQQIRGQLRPRI